MQVPKKHLPLVGILGMVVILAAGGGIYYYQFIIPHTHITYIPSHRLVFINATIVEDSPNGHGFEIKNLALLNQTTLPGFSSGGGANLTGVNYSKYAGESDNSTILAHPGDNITFYIFSQGVSDPRQIENVGHGFQITSPSGGVVVPPTTINFGQWYEFTITVTDSGTYVYRCSYPCSALHGNMAGNIQVG